VKEKFTKKDYIITSDCPIFYSIYKFALSYKKMLNKIRIPHKSEQEF